MPSIPRLGGLGKEPVRSPVTSAALLSQLGAVFLGLTCCCLRDSHKASREQMAVVVVSRLLPSSVTLLCPPHFREGDQFGVVLGLAALSTSGVWLALSHLSLRKVLEGRALLLHSGRSGSLVSLDHTVHGGTKIQMGLTRFICSHHGLRMVRPRSSRWDLQNQCSMLLPFFLGPLLLPFPGDQGTEAGGGYGSGGGWGQVVLQSRDPNKKNFFFGNCSRQDHKSVYMYEMSFDVDMVNCALSVCQSIWY